MFFFYFSRDGNDRRYHMALKEFRFHRGDNYIHAFHLEMELCHILCSSFPYALELFGVFLGWRALSVLNGTKSRIACARSVEAREPEQCTYIVGQTEVNGLF